MSCCQCLIVKEINNIIEKLDLIKGSIAIYGIGNNEYGDASNYILDMISKPIESIKISCTSIGIDCLDREHFEQINHGEFNDKEDENNNEEKHLIDGDYSTY